MRDHHIISEADQRHSCPQCGLQKRSEDWKSVFDPCNHHYKECICPSCGYRSTIKVSHIGSGHDSWDQRIRNIDQRIEEEEEE